MNKELIECVAFGVGMFTFIPARRSVHLIHFLHIFLYSTFMRRFCLIFKIFISFPRSSFSPSMFKPFSCLNLVRLHLLLIGPKPCTWNSPTLFLWPGELCTELASSCRIWQLSQLPLARRDRHLLSEGRMHEGAFTWQVGRFLVNICMLRWHLFSYTS